MKLQLTVDGKLHGVLLEERDDQWQLSCDGGTEISLREIFCDSNSIILQVDGRNQLLRYARRGSELYLHHNGRSRHIHLVDEAEQEEFEEREADPILRAPMPGRILAVLAKAGDVVAEGAPLVRIEAMKMEVDLPAAIAGTVKEIHVKVEELVEPDAPLVTLEPEASDES